MPRILLRWLVVRLARVTRRAPDFVIGDPGAPYLQRWYVIPRNRVCNVYLHCILRSDDDRALHDHPWMWCSLMLQGAYSEHSIRAGGVPERTLLRAGSLRVHRPTFAHRLEIRPEYGVCWTLFVTGPRVREWGFLCPERGWVHWRAFTQPGATGRTGKGCAA